MTQKTRVLGDDVLLSIALSVDRPADCAARLGVSVAIVLRRRWRLLVLTSGMTAPRLPKNNEGWHGIVEQALARFTNEEILDALKDNTPRPRINRMLTEPKVRPKPPAASERSSYPDGRILTVSEWVSELKNQRPTAIIIPFRRVR